MKIRTDHPFTKAQLKALNAELEKISPAQIYGMRGVTIPSLPDYSDIDILHSVYDTNVFLSFMDITDPDYPKSRIYSIDMSGKVDYEARQNLSFKSLADRVEYFNSLEPVKFEY